MKKKYKRDFNNVGRIKYNFSFQKEKNIYCNVCMRRMKRKRIKNLEEELKFCTYSEWKKYICYKYRDYDKETLEDFSRYLNQGIRNVQPGREYLNLFIPVILTLIVTETLNGMLKISEAIEALSIVAGIIVLLIVLVILFIPIIYFIWTTLIPICDNNIEESMFIDYKEIIDEIIESRIKNL